MLARNLVGFELNVDDFGETLDFGATGVDFLNFLDFVAQTAESELSMHQ